MRHQVAGGASFDRKFLHAAKCVAAIVVLLVFGLINAQRVLAQSFSADWEKAAGGKMAFEVASVKQNTTPPSDSTVHSNIPLGPQDFFAPTGGLLSATNVSLAQYMVFAYKLSPNQLRAVRLQLPKWANTNRYDIESRASGNPTKDQFRLMMQALLADRFKLTAHRENRQLPFYALVLEKSGRLGPHLQTHSEDPPCSTLPAPSDGVAPTIVGGFPEPCGALTDVRPSAVGRLSSGARNVSMQTTANSLLVLETFGNSNAAELLDRPILDKTGLTGTFDWVIEWTPQINGPRPPEAMFQPDPTGPTFQEALKEQLGLKLESRIGPVDVFVIDHVEQPSEN